MTNDRRMDSGDDRLDPVLERAVQSLRQEEPVSPAWRAELLARVEPTRHTRTRLFTLTPLGIAAALCLFVGLRRIRSENASDSLVASPTALAPSLGSTVNAIRFAFSAPAAQRVSLVGDFNRWNPSAVPMRRSSDGRTWIADVSLAPGRHVFAFAVDGGLRVDPSAPRAVEDDFGVPSSVIVVPRRGGE